MPRLMKWLGPLAAILLLITCFIPWVIIESRSITITGVAAEGTSFGKPGYFHFAMLLFFLVFSMVPKVWAKRANLAVAAINLAWAIRNYFILSACHAGECPIKKTGVYLVVATSVLMMLAALFPSVTLEAKNRGEGIIRES